MALHPLDRQAPPRLAAPAAPATAGGTAATAVGQVLPAPDHRWRAVLVAPRAVAVVTALGAVAATAAGGGPAVLAQRLAGPGASAGAAGAALLVASILVGLPHGAVDLVRPEVAERRPGARAVRPGVAAALYAGSAAVALGCWLLAPLAVLLALLALAVVHFGTADDVTDRWLAGVAPPGAPLVRLARVVAAGGAPVSLPLGLHGRAVAGVLDDLSGGSGSAVVAAARAAVPVVLLAAVATAALAARRRRWGAALEPLTLAALFAAVTPLLAFAVYFGLWHSWRQVARMVAADAVRGGVRPATALAGFARQAALPTAVSLIVLGVALPTASRSALATALIAVLCLTVPHSAVVARTDRHLRLAGSGDARATRHDEPTPEETHHGVRHDRS